MPISGNLSQLLADDTSQGVFQFGRRLLALDVVAQHVIDDGLVIAAARVFHLIAEVIEDVAIQPDRDALLPRRQRQYRAAFSFAEVVGFHRFSYASRS